MKLIFIVLCVTYCAQADSQENDEAVLQSDLEEFLRRLTQQPGRSTRTFHSSFLPDSWAGPRQAGPGGGSSYEETSRRVSAYLYPPLQDGGGAVAGGSARVNREDKRPSGPSVNVEEDAGAMFGSLADVDQEESLGMGLDVFGKGTTQGDMKMSSPMEYDSTDVSSSERTGPYTMKQQQTDTVIRKEDDSFGDVYFVAIVAGCCAVGIFGVISAGVCFYRLQKSRKAAADVDYPAYGVTGPCKDLTSPNGDRKLAQSAQMYHFQHQKQQMIAVEKAGSTKNTSASDVDSEEENEEGDYTVYECPGLAPTGEMEVKNPLFNDDSTPVSPAVMPPKTDSTN